MKKDAQKKLNKDNMLALLLNYKVVFILIILVIATHILTNGLFLTRDNLLSVARQIAVTTILGIGYTVVLACGGIDLSIGNMVSALGIIYAYTAMRSPIAIAIILTILCGMAFGLTNGFLSERFKMPAFIVTLAMGEVFKGIAYLVNNGQAVAVQNPTMKLIGQGLIGGFFPISYFFVIILTIVFSILMMRTKFGRHVIATGGNMQAARVSGISTVLVRIKSYIILACCAALGAIVLTGRVGVAVPTAGTGMDMDAIAAVIIGGTPLMGGKGNVLGTVFGCFVIGIIGNCLNLMGINPFWQWVAKGLIILSAMFIDSMSEKFFSSRRVAASN